MRCERAGSLGTQRPGCHCPGWCGRRRCFSTTARLRSSPRPARRAHRREGPEGAGVHHRLGAPLRTSNFRQRYWLVAVRARGLAGLRVRDLRQSAVSLAVNSGANPKVVQQMLGHASAAMTLDVYAGLFNPDLDDVADRLDEAARAAGSVSQVCPIERSAGTIGSVDEGQDDDDDGLGGVAAHVR
ncbi:MAG TPA: tyrosine-type recombinase/integrase [Acidimicrobiales bacterium]|nr:tyrosine-type recombinase/integrase [Acidimicrobiales bacterium]